LIALRDIFDWRKAFASQSEIKQAVSDKYKTRKENFVDARLLLIFSGSKQRTWLVATQSGLYLVTDRLKEDVPKAVWRLDRSDIMSGNTPELEIRVDPYSENTGKIKIGDKAEKFFSKDLFTDVSVDRRIQSLVESAFASTQRGNK
jgi:hypothetical protein